MVSLEDKNNFLYVTLKDSIFYPGGGGQPSDHGIIETEDFSGDIVSLDIQNNRFVHKVKKIHGTLDENNKITIKIDWDRRYDLMKFHTAEHIFFKSLSHFTDTELIKIDLKKTSSIFVSSEVNWNDIFKAEKLANDIIDKDMRVNIKTHHKNKIESIYGNELRIKFDRIKDNNVRVVEIGDFDRAACSGLHVKRTNEIGQILVTKLRVSGEYTEIKFVIGENCKKLISEYTNAMRLTTHLLNTPAMKVPKVIKNIISEKEELWKKIKSLSKDRVDFNNEGKLYWGLFENIDFKTLQKKANDVLEKDDGVVIGAIEDGNLFVMSNILNAKDILMKILDKYEGKGGGKMDFASGYCENVKDMIDNVKHDFEYVL